MIPMLTNRQLLEMSSRTGARAVYCGPDAGVLCKVLGRFHLYVNPLDTGIANHLMLDGFWESWVTVAINSIVSRGMHVIDVGANVGYYSVLMADLVGTTGHVIAYEPNNELLPLLRASVWANGQQDRVMIVPLACGDVPGQSQLVYPRRMPGSGSIMIEPSANEIRRQGCDVVRLDENSLGMPLDFLKVDAEGMDHKVILGARRMLAQNPHAQVLFEHYSIFFPSPREAADALREVLEIGPYRLHHVDYDGNIAPIDVLRVNDDPSTLWHLLLRR